MLALAARLHYSTLTNLLLPNQFPNFSQLRFLQVSDVPVPPHNERSSLSFPLPFCKSCAVEAERIPSGLCWEVGTGLPTTILCLQHGESSICARPECADTQLVFIWKETRPLLRCSQCCWRPTPVSKNEFDPAEPSGPRGLLCHLQRDIVAALRGSPPSNFWFGTIAAAQFLTVLDDLYWLLRTPGLSAIGDPSSTFSDAFFWISSLSNSRLLFHRTGYSPFSAWHPDPRAELLLAIAATMLGERSFVVLRRRPYYPPPSHCYPFCWMLRSLHTKHASRLQTMKASWPSTLRSRLCMAGQHGM